jgi:hypothetical protein
MAKEITIEDLRKLPVGNPAITDEMLLAILAMTKQPTPEAKKLKAEILKQLKVVR